MKVDRKWLAVLLAAYMMAGCGKVGSPDAVSEGESLRSRTDAARGRLWVLGVDGVRVYGAADKKVIRRVALPNWSVARYVCDPDLVIDAAGSALVSSNVQAKLWRIDAGSFAVTEHPVTLQGRERWDIGFGALGYGSDGALLALTSSTGVLWRVDLDQGSARMLQPKTAFLNRCELTAQLLKDIEGGQQR